MIWVYMYAVGLTVLYIIQAVRLSLLQRRHQAMIALREKSSHERGKEINERMERHYKAIEIETLQNDSRFRSNEAKDYELLIKEKELNELKETLDELGVSIEQRENIVRDREVELNKAIINLDILKSLKGDK